MTKRRTCSPAEVRGMTTEYVDEYKYLDQIISFHDWSNEEHECRRGGEPSGNIQKFSVVKWISQ